VDKDLTTLVDALIDAECIYTMGWGPSHYIADIFTMRMKLMGLKSHSLKRRDATLINEVGQIQSRDALIVFEMPPYVHEVLTAVKLAKSTQTDIFLVTDKSQCPVIEYAALSFFCSTDTSLFGNSMTGLLFWVNLISSQMMLKIKDKVMVKLEKQRKIFKDSRYYIQ
jgi:DNA-binding MurR/RpiR family transcriptional regulator